MHSGAITNNIDVAQLALYAFWIFFVGLIIYLRREDKREGYPLSSDRSPHIRVEGYPATPEPKFFRLAHGGTCEVPNSRPEAVELRAKPVGKWPGAPLQPTGDPMRDGVGPAAYANRADVPDLTFEGEPKIVPMRIATDFSIEARDPDPRGMPAIGADGQVGGIVRDVWVDRSEPTIRYLEVEVSTPENNPRVLLPIGLAKVNGRKRQVQVNSILGSQFSGVPGIRNPDQVTALEEDRICAYYGGGTLYATPDRQEPLI
jgi:photosynthetic reaction center H subunit